MTNTDLRCLSDADLQSLIDRAKNEKVERAKRKKDEIKKNFWDAAIALYKADPYYDFCTMLNDWENVSLKMLLQDAGKVSR